MSADARRLVIRGRVQGVGFRDAAIQAAYECGVHGWVRNRRDDSVEAFVQGERDAVDRFVAWCERGPPLARVAQVASEAASLESGLVSFTMRASV
jgi:acylphosphatase